jgi:uncharacterized protein
MSAALVTGASSGIGAELARALAQAGHDLILVARRQPSLETLAAALRAAHGVRVEVWPEDLCDLAAPRRLEARLRMSGLSLTMLVNNAGVGASGPFVESDATSEARMILLNVYALNQLTRLLLPFLIASGQGAVLNVASTAAFQPVPLMATYAASKAFVLSFSQALADELAGQGVVVTALCPGPTDTTFVTNAGVAKTRLFAPSKLAAPVSVARVGLKGLARRKPVVIVGLWNRVLAAASAWVPRAVLMRLSRRLMAAH